MPLRAALTRACPLLAACCSRRCGLEVPARLVWSKWEPGGEYTKSITIKNVSGKVRTLR